MNRILHAVLFEMFVAFLAFLAIAFIWALVRPAWTLPLLQYTRHHAWHALCLFLLGIGIIVLVFSVMR